MPQIIGQHGIPAELELERMIYQQTSDLVESTSFHLNNNDRARIFSVTMACIYKLGVIKYHHDRFMTEWKKRFEEVIRQKDQDSIVEESTLAYELEAFVFQIKSSLDAVVKVLKPITGEELVSYGEYGDKVVKLLKNNLSDDLKPRADKLKELVENHKQWIQYITNLRDMLIHHTHKCRGLRNFFFEKTGEPKSAKAPRIFDGGDAQILMHNAWWNIRLFIVDFLALSMYICMPAAITLSKNAEPGKIDRWYMSLHGHKNREKK